MANNSKSEIAFWLDRRFFERRVTREEAEAFCQRLARSHYENFTVISLLLPRRLRQHFSNVYAYCRVADDLADELGDPEHSLARLEEWKEHLDRCYQGDATHPVFVALESTIREFELPKEPFENLLAAFRQDQYQVRYLTWQQLLEYCRNSANPVGRLVLYLCGYKDEWRQRLSDDTCTALQLTNFWQDVDRDYAKGRIYLPREIMEEHGYSEEMLERRVFNQAWVLLMQDLVGRTRFFFQRGRQLRSLVHRRVRLDIELFSRGGLEILRAIEEVGYDTLHRRPELSAWRKTGLMLGSVIRTLLPQNSTLRGTRE